MFGVQVSLASHLLNDFYLGDADGMAVMLAATTHTYAHEYAEKVRVKRVFVCVCVHWIRRNYAIPCITFHFQIWANEPKCKKNGFWVSRYCVNQHEKCTVSFAICFQSWNLSVRRLRFCLSLNSAFRDTREMEIMWFESGEKRPRAFWVCAPALNVEADFSRLNRQFRSRIWRILVEKFIKISREWGGRERKREFCCHLTHAHETSVLYMWLTLCWLEAKWIWAHFACQDSHDMRHSWINSFHSWRALVWSRSVIVCAWALPSDTILWICR